MKNIIRLLSITIIVLLSGCADQDNFPKQKIDFDERTVTVSAAMPSDNSSTRISLHESEGSLTLSPKWDADDVIKLIFVQDDIKVVGESAKVYNISEDGKQCSFNLTLPEDIEITKPFTLYTFADIPGFGVKIENGEILADISPIRMKTIDEMPVPVWSKTDISSFVSDDINLTYKNLGAYEVIQVKNGSSSNLNLTECQLIPHSESSALWYYSESANIKPAFKPETGKITDYEYYSSEGSRIRIASGETETILSWYVPNGENIPELSLKLDDKTSYKSKEGKDFGMQAGRAYYIYAVWDDYGLFMTDDDYVVPELTPEEQEELELEAIIKVQEEIAPIANAALESDNPEEELQKVVEQFKDNSEIEDVYFDNDKLMLKYRNGGWVYWYIYDKIRATQMTSDQAFIFDNSSLVRSVSKKDYPKILSINVYTLDSYFKDFNENYHSYIEMLTSNGYNVDHITGEDFDLSFAGNHFKGYDVVALFTHGNYDKTSGITWIETGEKIPTITKILEIGKYSFSWKRGLISYNQSKNNIAISSKYIEDQYNKNDFKPNSLFYFGTCYSLKDLNNGFANVLNNYGFKSIIGYDDITIDFIFGYNFTRLINNLIEGETYNYFNNHLQDEVRFEKEIDNEGRGIYKLTKGEVLPTRQQIFFDENFKLEAITNLVSYPSNTDYRFYYLELEKQNTTIPITENSLKEIAILSGSGNYSVKSSNTQVATATISSGKVIVKAVVEGTSKITVTDTYTKQTAEFDVVVSKATIPVSSIEVIPTSVNIVEGQGYTLTATVKPSNATNSKVTWKSSATSIAEVNQNGRMTAKKEGSAIITATTEDGNKSASCTVTVTKAAVPVTSIEVIPTSVNIVEGQGYTLTATVKPSNATNQNVTWKSSATGIAEVNQNGRVTAKKEGNAIITATTEDGNKSASCSITITKATVPVTGITVTPTSKTLNIGESFSITANVLPSNATNQEVSWRTSSAGVATVDANGRVTAKGWGNATISAVTEDGNKTATCAVNVKVPDLKLSAETVNMKVDESATVSITSGSGSYEVTSSNSSVVYAGINGNVLNISALNGGMAYITITDKISGQTVRVNVFVSEKLKVSVENILIKPDESQTIDIVSGSGRYTVVSKNENMAYAVVSGSKIAVMGIAPGQTELTVTDTNTGEKVIIYITVNNWVKLIANPKTLALKPNETGTVIITSGSGSFTVKSNNSSVATATISGNTVTVKGVAPGSTDVVITDTKANETATVSVTVTAHEVPNLTLSAESVSVKVGETKTVRILSGSGRYSTGNQNPELFSVQLQGQSEISISITGVAAGSGRVQVNDDTSQQRKYINVVVTGGSDPGTGGVSDLEGENF